MWSTESAVESKACSLAAIAQMNLMIKESAAESCLLVPHEPGQWSVQLLAANSRWQKVNGKGQVEQGKINGKRPMAQGSPIRLASCR